MTLQQLQQSRPDLYAEYTDLYAKRVELQRVYYQRLLGGVASATLSTAGNSQSYTALSLAELRGEINALTRRLRQILLGPAGDRRLVPSYPDFGP